MAIETSIVVEFGEDVPSEEDTLVIELDPTDTAGIALDNNLELDSNGDWQLKSTFAPTDHPVFIVNHSSTVQIDNVKATSGTISNPADNISISKTEDFLFTGATDEKHTLNYAGVQSGTPVWHGNSATLDITDSIATVSGATYPAICTVTFPVIFQKQYQLTPPSMTLSPGDSYKITIVVYASII